MSDETYCACGHLEIQHGMQMKARSVKGFAFLVPDSNAPIERTGCGIMGCPCQKYQPYTRKEKE